MDSGAPSSAAAAIMATATGAPLGGGGSGRGGGTGFPAIRPRPPAAPTASSHAVRPQQHLGGFGLGGAPSSTPASAPILPPWDPAAAAATGLDGLLAQLMGDPATNQAVKGVTGSAAAGDLLDLISVAGNLQPPPPPHGGITAAAGRDGLTAWLDGVTQAQASPDAGDTPASMAAAAAAAKRVSAACARCREKKRKCDGRQPVCGNCEKAQARGDAAVCVYTEPMQRRERKKGYKDALMDKLTGLESLLREQQRLAAQAPAAPGPWGEPDFFAALSANRRLISEMIDGEPQQQSSQSPESGGASGGSGDDSPPARLTSAQAFEKMASTVDRLFPSPPTQAMDVITGGETDGGSSAVVVARKGSRRRTDEAVVRRPMGLPGGGGLASDSRVWDYAESLFRSPAPPGGLAGSMSHFEAYDDIIEMVLRETGSGGGGVSVEAATRLASQPFTRLTAVARPNFEDLTYHLVSIYFVYINTTYPIFDEALFLSEFVPINRHPTALIDAISLLKDHETPFKASYHFMKRAEDGIAKVEDSVAAIQVMIILALWEYIKLFETTQACLDYRFSIWRGPSIVLSPEAARTRRLTFISLFILDSGAGMITGLPTALFDQDYLDVMLDWEEEHPLFKDEAGSQASVPQQQSAAYSSNMGVRVVNDAANNPQLGRREWMRVFGKVPSHTVFDFPTSPYPHPLCDTGILDAQGRGGEAAVLGLMARGKDDTAVVSE
ncbi:hypothetical protein HK405_005475 [Cladochytrium tenue]|nr:hypothetical protein HK405_005475 [Cladochytrium tenue]